MPKSRLCNPPNHRDGIWFPHSDGFQSVTMPSTMAMLKHTELLKAQDPEWRRPLKFAGKTQKDLKTDFPFSFHDNRHSIQDSAEYFDGGVGRKKADKGKGGQASQNFVQWAHDVPPKATTYLDGYSNYQTSYLNPQVLACPSIFGRYPKSHLVRSFGIAALPENDVARSADANIQTTSTPPNVEPVSHSCFPDSPNHPQ
ncbi:testis-expressed protein 36 isoform X1 [Ambystoma mexicanum]|uniref:testis-expressed protein 36 isoform X1 n=1 Tax=Ambystoma mexicanum TaxID=8296 RepID=UPI0037E888EC